jgi:hypothetical protein
VSSVVKRFITRTGMNILGVRGSKGVKADTSLAVLCTYSKTIGSNFPNERLLLFSGIR